MMFPGPLSKHCFSSFSEEAIPNAQRAEKETAGSLWLTHFGHDLILDYHFSFLLQCFKNQGLTLFLYINIKYYSRIQRTQLEVVIGIKVHLPYNSFSYKENIGGTHHML